VVDWQRVELMLLQQSANWRRTLERRLHEDCQQLVADFRQPQQGADWKHVVD
jgi:hypothetical protein